MFLALCKNNLSCARGHVPILSCRSAILCQNVWNWKGSPIAWSQKIPLKTIRTDRKWLQRLKSKFYRAGQWPKCMHVLSGRLNDFTSASDTERHGLFKNHSESVFSKITAPTNQDGFYRAEAKADNFTSTMCRSDLRSLDYNPQVFGLTRIFNIRWNWGCLQWSKGFCTSNPGKPHADEEQSSLKQNSTRDPDTSQGAAAPSPNESSSQFKELYENPWTIPNFLCMMRIGLSPVLGYLIMEQYFHMSLGLFAFAGATDLLDGYIARNWPSQKSALGSALDPLADKILISVLYISLTYAQLIPAPLTALVISRDIALIAAVFYVRYKTVPPPVTLGKFFNPCYTTAQLKPTLISKINTAIQLFLVAVSLASPVFHYTDSVLLQSLWYVTALTTVASGYSYYHYGRKTVEVLNNTK
ncbi:cardiolipin synthase (CMP-forming) [Chanos chanos]|uniref:Cardiolipin synthase (CMP-forming) n=1 Tax=Chanos chanos TaxID=29144 RepID=A0A6J2VU81_CHACN|nr:cardiolipin synthase (CMP-forming) [Chanos chanos]